MTKASKTLFLFFCVLPLILAAPQDEVFTAMIQNIVGLPSDWKAADVSKHCNWTGVRCVKDLVFTLELPKKNLSGSLSIDFGPFFKPSINQLATLDFSGNELSGTVSASLFGQGLMMMDLWLNDNRLSGTLPAYSGEAAEVFRSLMLQNNLISGCIPKSWELLTYCGTNDHATCFDRPGKIQLYNNPFDCSKPDCMDSLPKNSIQNIPCFPRPVNGTCPLGKKCIPEVIWWVIIGALCLLGLLFLILVVTLIRTHSNRSDYTQVQ